MTLDMTARDYDTVAHLLGSVDALSNEIARQRARLRSTWQGRTQAVDRALAQIRAVDFSLDRRTTSFDDLVRSFGQHPADGRGDPASVPAASVDGWLQENGNGTWAVKTEIERRFDEDYNTARQRLIEARNKTFGSGARRAGTEALGRYRLRLAGLTDVRQLLEKQLSEAAAARDDAAASERAMADRALAPAVSVARHAVERLPAPLQPWGSDSWSRWRAAEPVAGVNIILGGLLTAIDDPDLGTNASFGSDARVPFFVSLRQTLELVYTNSSREPALALARSLLLRQLASAVPGELQFSFYDPIGLGQSVAELLDLAEYDQDLIGGKVWSAPQDLAARLAELTSHIELVTQKYLRSTYDDIDDFNRAAGEVAEPYRLLVLFDFPTGLSEETLARLTSVVLNGPRCGVHTLLLANTSVTAPYGVDASQIAGHVRRINLDANFADEHHGYTLQLRLRPELETSHSTARATMIIDAVGRAAIGRTESAVTFDKVMGLFSAVAGRGIRTELSQHAAMTQADQEATWWQEQSTRGLFAPIGQKGARDIAILGFDSGDHAGALLVGRPGSGKSTLLHTYIGGLTTLYGPDELELYLIDFKEGVEFKSYAAEGLPHARVVAIESDREFGVSVLQSIRDELARRGELFRSTGGQQAGIGAFRQASGNTLPRVLLVFDEFQVLFAKNDRLGLAAADMLETIIRQGRGFGVHVLLGSQSLSGLDALGAHVPQLLPTRILLPASELDARRVLGDGNDAGQYLTTHGEGILNSAGGAVEANERFKGALLTEQDRITRLRTLRAKADRAGYSRRPSVFEGNAAVPLESIPPAQFREELASSGTAGIRLRAGVSMTVHGLADVQLNREAGANVLAVVRDGPGDSLGAGPAAGPAYGLLVSALAAAAQSPARIDVIDFMSVDDGLDETLEPFLDCGRLTLRRRRAFAPLVQDLAAAVRDRIDADDALRTGWIVVLFGIHRARELDAEIGGLDGDAELSEALEGVMRDGPEVGVHVWLWADNVNGVSRRLTPRMIRECSWRIAGKMSPDDSMSLIGTEQAAEIRDRQLVLSNDDLGVATRAIGFSLPSGSWLAQVLSSSGSTAYGRRPGNA